MAPCTAWSLIRTEMLCVLFDFFTFFQISQVQVGDKTVGFNYVYATTSTQSDVYEECAMPMVERVLNGESPRDCALELDYQDSMPLYSPMDKHRRARRTRWGRVPLAMASSHDSSAIYSALITRLPYTSPCWRYGISFE